MEQLMLWDPMSFLETMGLENVIKAQQMLNLDPTWSAEESL
jgi:hypothetical protein